MKKTFAFLIMLLPLSLFAHGGHGSGFMAGFTHPIFGLDHNIALIGTGILGYLLDQKRWYFYPAAFIGLMVIGGYLGIGKEATILIEKIIAASVIVIGLIIGLRLNFGRIIIALMFAAFGFTHGFAHGAEMPADTTAFQYISGFAIGAILLAIIGCLLSFLATSQNSHERLHTLLGGILIGAGIVLLI